MANALYPFVGQPQDSYSPEVMSWILGEDKHADAIRRSVSAPGLAYNEPAPQPVNVAASAGGMQRVADLAAPIDGAGSDSFVDLPRSNAVPFQELRPSFEPSQPIDRPAPLPPARPAMVTGSVGSQATAPRQHVGALPAGQGFAQTVYEQALSTGLPDTQARLVAAQAALESNHGRSGLSRNANNYFGIKAGRSWRGDTASYRTREENAQGAGYYINDRFRKYASPVDSFRDHVSLLQRRYPEAYAALSFDDAVEGLRYGRPGGYATDQNYGAKLRSIARGLRGRSGPAGSAVDRAFATAPVPPNAIGAIRRP